MPAVHKAQFYILSARHVPIGTVAFARKYGQKTCQIDFSRGYSLVIYYNMVDTLRSPYLLTLLYIFRCHAHISELTSPEKS